MPHNRILIEGLMGTQERWSTSVRFTNGTENTPVMTNSAEMTQWAQDTGVYIQTGIDILANCLSSAGSVNTITAQLINDDGTLANQGSPFDMNEVGLGTPKAPYQTAVVISDITSNPGARYRGRHYWPCVGLGMTTNGRLTTPTLPADILADWADLVTGIRDSTGGPAAEACMYSPTRSSTTSVVGYRVGDVPDTQRRRRDKLIENYSAIAYP